jgi:hypothetical protein
MNGQVPASLTYPQWLKQQSAAIQDEVLGATRGRLFRNGQVKIDQFVNNAHEVLPLAELIKKERAVFAALGITLNPTTGRVLRGSASERQSRKKKAD